jgi:RND family efflux transporter MFP subunit
MKRFSCLFILASICWAQKIELVPVVSKSVSQTIDLPGEFLAFQSVELHARVRGYVEKMLVDRGSQVKQGQLLATITAPEMKAYIAEATSKVSVAESDRLQAMAQLESAKSTYERLKKASETAGAISGNELVQAQEQVEAAQAAVESKQQAKAAAEETVKAQKDMETYLQITAPFSGVITERLVHPGALVGPGPDPVMLVLEDISHLRLVVAVPEQNAASIVKGAKVDFHVPASPQRTYAGTVARIAHVLDEKTRAMAVELDVQNRDGLLAPGMYPSVKWPVHSLPGTLLVPKTAVVTTTERTFVIRDHQGKAEWVSVSKGISDGDLVQVSGAIAVGDRVVKRASDEIREGDEVRVSARPVS